MDSQHKGLIMQKFGCFFVVMLKWHALIWPIFLWLISIPFEVRLEIRKTSIDWRPYSTITQVFVQELVNTLRPRQISLKLVPKGSSNIGSDASPGRPLKKIQPHKATSKAWCHHMETLCALLAFCYGIPPDAGGLLAERVINADLLRVLCCSSK